MLQKPDLQIAQQADLQVPQADGLQLDALVAEAQLGARVRILPGWRITASGGAGLTSALGTPDFRLLFGLGYQPEAEPVIVDTDLDGLMDPDDACPTEPEDKDEFEDSDGCPDADNDKDGVPDVRDGVVGAGGFGACLNEPEDQDGFEDEDGCPDPDNDQDGVPDTSDGAVEANGFGGCRDQAEDKDGWEDADGCPDPDNDNDGLLDGDDTCPNEPENVNNYKDEDGCPDIVFNCTEFKMPEKIFFRTGSHRIQPQSLPLLDVVAETIIAHPEAALTEIQGHTDRRGGRRYNRRLSDRRAHSVREYLIGKGVDASRLQSKGYGPDQPLEEGQDGPEYYDQNRRVQFIVLQLDPTKSERCQ